MTILSQKCVELVPCGEKETLEAQVLTRTTQHLEWDRHMRLSQTARHVVTWFRAHAPEQLEVQPESPRPIVLDVGGFDGALALFLPSHFRVWVVDPESTGASGDLLPFPDRHFETVVSVDAIEHMPAEKRPLFVRELLRVCRRALFVNFPQQTTMDSQRLALELTGNRFIDEHVRFVLPSPDEVTKLLKDEEPNLRLEVIGHTSSLVWLPFFVLLHRDRPAAMQLGELLKTDLAAEHGPFLYCLVISNRQP